VLKLNRSKSVNPEISDLGLFIGDTLQLHFDHDRKHKYYTKLIGYLPNKSIIVTSPRHDGKLLPLRNGNTVTVKMLSDCSVLGFKTRIMSLSEKPYPYIHLDYPMTTGKIVVRKSQRVKSKLIITVQTENIDGPVKKPISAATFDLSACGALIESPLELGKQGDLLTLLMRINIGSDSEYMTVPAILRHIRFDKHPDNDRRLYFHGVEFQILEQHDSVMLHGFLYQQMASQHI